jgi:two-component system NtrC family response regulator
MKGGAADYLPKPFDNDELELVVERVLEGVELRRDLRSLQEQVRGAYRFENLVGKSAGMQSVVRTARQVAQSDIPVLITGESGTGKEMVAQELHRLSGQTRGPFVAINCNSIPENLLESELFGHERGAFTGAHAQRQGRIETAEGGTLFLDEIGELSGPLQVKLLRFLQDHEVERVGGRSLIKVDTRVIAATNIDLGKKAMEEGRFRVNLYYRLAVLFYCLL